MGSYKKKQLSKFTHIKMLMGCELVLCATSVEDSVLQTFSWRKIQLQSHQKHLSLKRDKDGKCFTITRFIFMTGDRHDHIIQCKEYYSNKYIIHQQRTDSQALIIQKQATSCYLQYHKREGEE